MEQCNDMFLISGIRPAMLKVIEPTFGSMAYCDTQDSDAAEDTEASRLLALASCVYSQWFILMKSIMTRERVIARSKYEGKTGKRVWGELPYSKAPCERQPLTAADLAASSAYESVIRATFGNKAADFARERFFRAISTGDKRSFKIRFLFYKSSDGLKGTVLFEPFRKRLENVVTEAEAAAGCTPDPSPRRMSLAEQERKRRKEMEPKQLDLFDYVGLCQNESGKRGKVDASDHGDVHGDGGVPHGQGARPAEGADNGSVDAVRSGDNRIPDGGARDDSKKRGRGFGQCGIRSIGQDVVRKTKAYACCAELLKDIESGAVTPYHTTEEVVADIKRGLITPSEAVIFLAELGKRNKRTTNFVWGEPKMPAELNMAGPAPDGDSPSDSELDDIEEEDGDSECEETGDVELPSELGIFTGCGG